MCGVCVCVWCGVCDERGDGVVTVSVTQREGVNVSPVVSSHLGGWGDPAGERRAGRMGREGRRERGRERGKEGGREDLGWRAASETHEMIPL